MNALTKSTARLPMPPDAGCTPAQWRVLTDAIFPSAKSSESIMLALQYCSVRKLDVFKRPVHIVPMYNSALKKSVETIWPGINELQVTAARTRQWAGIDQPEWGPEITRTFRGTVGEEKRKVEVTLTFPEWCSVTVYRMIAGQKCGFAEPVYWLESYTKSSYWSEVPNAMWQQRTRGQLHKNAKAASLRAAFPEEAGNDYTAEEMEGKETDGGVVIEADVLPTTQPPAKTTEEIVAPQPTFIQRVENAVAKARDASQLLKLMQRVIPQTETMDDLAAVWGIPAVQTLWTDGPSLVRMDLVELRKEAVDRLSPKEEADAGDENFDPDADEDDFPGDPGYQPKD